MKKKIILIIEDDTHIIRVYKQKFEKDYDVHYAIDGESGLQMAKEEPPDLIILDLVLPGDTVGFDVLHALKKDSHLADIPIIVITNVETSRSKIIDEGGAVEYMVKPETSLSKVAEKVAEYLK